MLGKSESRNYAVGKILCLAGLDLLRISLHHGRLHLIDANAYEFAGNLIPWSERWLLSYSSE